MEKFFEKEVAKGVEKLNKGDGKWVKEAGTSDWIKVPPKDSGTTSKTKGVDNTGKIKEETEVRKEAGKTGKILGILLAGTGIYSAKNAECHEQESSNKQFH